MLQKAGAISYSRGIITITNRALLEASSCGCYELIKSEFARLIGWEGGEDQDLGGRPEALPNR
jgi:hypothetical protein